jgi:3-phosphoinositide dependent protein kinase-1
MQALRDHPFFSSINWKTLWTEPAPPLESGLVKREHPLAGQDQNWEDVGAAWDDIADCEDEGDENGDGIRWADDAEGPAYIVRHEYGKGQKSSHSYSEEVGPMGEMPTFVKAALREHLDEDVETVMGDGSPESGTAVEEPEPIDVPADTGSASSSDSSPVEKVGTALGKMKIDRGRNRAQTPVQGNGHILDANWYASFHSFCPAKIQNFYLTYVVSLSGHHYYYPTRRSYSLHESKNAPCDGALADSSPSPSHLSNPRIDN